jgi:hypothetical protein
MPAVHISRLRIQSAQVAEQFGNPPALLRSLHEMFEMYADRTRRPGKLASPVTVLPSYSIPTPALRQLEADLGLQAENRLEETSILADALWRDGYLESRLLAAFLLGRVEPRGEDFMERLTDWVSHAREPNLRRTLLTTSLARLRREEPDSFVRLIRRWVHPTYDRMWSRAIEALLPVLTDPAFHNLPVVLEVVRPIVEAAPPVMQNELADLINALYRSSPKETAVYLRQTLAAATHSQTRVTFRRILPRLPEPLRNELAPQLRRPA